MILIIEQSTRRLETCTAFSIVKMSSTPHHIGHCSTVIRVHCLATMSLRHFCTNIIWGHCCTTKSLCYGRMPQWRNNVFQQWRPLRLLHNILQQWNQCSHVLGSNEHGRTGCIPSRKNWTDKTDRQTGRPIRCSSLTLERGEHLKTVVTVYGRMIAFLIP